MMEDADVMAMNDADLEAALAGQGPPRLSEGLDLLPGMSPLESPGLHLDIGSLF